MRRTLGRAAICASIGGALLLSGGCGSGELPDDNGASAVPLSADLPSCTSYSGVIPPAASYHLPTGASERDQFFLAIIQDDRGSLDTLLAAGVSANSVQGSYSVDSDGLITFTSDPQAEQTPALEWAATLSYSGGTIRSLLAKGADFHVMDHSGNTALMAAAMNEKLDPSGFQALLDAGADIHEHGSQRSDVLGLAVATSNPDHGVICRLRRKLEALQRSGADINQNDKSAYPPLIKALLARNLGVARLIRALGGNLRAQAAADGSSVLHAVALAGDDSVETVRWLLSREADSRAVDEQGKTAIELFKENLEQGRCYSTYPVLVPSANPCADGTRAIIKLIEHHHRR